MQQAIPSLTSEVKQRLEDQGFKPFKYRPLPEYANPHSLQYWLTNAGLGLICLVGRHYATSQQSIRILWSASAVFIPLYAIATNAKLDGLRQNNFYRKTLDDRLELHPLTRRAWERAKQTHKEYQDQLREEIATLEAELRK
ncbi:unnamed protein product [Paramecium pentaurelia]|uniref:Uncharacterized protein n=1 Tax=Paramecium pentaurelia TaxID=43138 RepID=A0A8S1RYB4_9CILI|nr:unnamed protein product [Paramecium pentaurelia]